MFLLFGGGEVVAFVSTWLTLMMPGRRGVCGALLMEDGDYLLQESGDRLLLS